MDKRYFILVCLFLAGGCSYRTIVASQDFSGDASPAAARPVTDSVYLLGSGDPPPNSSQQLADMTLYSPLIWLKSYDHSPLFLMLDRAKKEAREMGGNAIQILECSTKKFARLRLAARVYSLPHPPEAVPPNRCIVHLKSKYPAGSMAPVPIYFNDSVIAVSKGSDHVEYRNLEFDMMTQQQMEQFNIELDSGGILSIKERTHRFPHQLQLEAGQEYYIVVARLYNRQLSEHFFAVMTKEEFEMDLYRY